MTTLMKMGRVHQNMSGMFEQNLCLITRESSQLVTANNMNFIEFIKTKVQHWPNHKNVCVKH